MQSRSSGGSAAVARGAVTGASVVVLALLAGVLSALGPAAGPAAGATASKPLNVLLLGDSYSAGNGSRDSAGDRDYSGVKGCYRSPSNWASQYVAKVRAAGQPVRFTNKACSGAVTADMLQDRQMEAVPAPQLSMAGVHAKDDPALLAQFDTTTGCSKRPVTDPVEEYWKPRILTASTTLDFTVVNGDCERYIKRQLDWVTPDVDLVLMTMGGNDIFFGDIVHQCFLPADRNVSQCRDQVGKSGGALTGALTTLKQIFAQMDAVLRPEAKVALLSYPLLELRDDYTLSRPGDSYRAGAAIRAMGRSAVREQQVAVDAANSAAGRMLVRFIPNMPDAFGTHEPDARLLSTNPARWIYETPPGDLSKIFIEFYHPNPSGQAAIADLLYKSYGTFGVGPRSTARNDIDVAFVIDTTGSMQSAIDRVRTYASKLASQLASGASSYRFALVDYRDQPGHTGSAIDYPSRLDVPFTSNISDLQAGLDGLVADGGGDTPESAYSGMMEALDLPWRPGVQKVLITMTDAPAHDPEPVSDLVAADVVTKALAIDPVQVYSVDVSSSDAASGLAAVAEQTGGRHYRSVDDSDIPAALSSALSTALSKPSAWLNGPVDVRSGRSVMLSAEGSYSTDGSALTYDWDFTGDGTYDQTTTAPTVQHTYLDGTVGLLSLRVRDGAGQTALATTPVRATSDGDSVQQAGDNCPTEWNDDQGDRDADGVGDACDPTPGYENGDGVMDDGSVVADPDGNSTTAAVTTFRSAPWNVRSTLPAGDPADYFGLTVSKAADVHVLLSSLAADFDLQVLSVDGRVVAASATGGRHEEDVHQRLASGRYFVGVLPKAGQSSAKPYTLVVTSAGGKSGR